MQVKHHKSKNVYFSYMAKAGSEVSAFNEAPHVVPQIGLQVSDTSQCINQTPPLNQSSQPDCEK